MYTTTLAGTRHTFADLKALLAAASAARSGDVLAGIGGPGRQDSERNCISNIRPPTGRSYEQAASRVARLMHAARHQRLTGVGQKDSSNVLSPPGPSTRL